MELRIDVRRIRDRRIGEDSQSAGAQSEKEAQGG